MLVVKATEGSSGDGGGVVMKATEAKTEGRGGSSEGSDEATAAATDGLVTSFVQPICLEVLMVVKPSLDLPASEETPVEVNDGLDG